MHHRLPPCLCWPLGRPRGKSVVLGFPVVLGLCLLSGHEHGFAQGGVLQPDGAWRREAV